MAPTNKIPTYIVNAFTTEPFTGNPAAVCLAANETDVTDDYKQRLASEFNLSETAFITPIESGTDFVSASRFGLRWFTPATEVTLCGHATLASAAVLFNCVGNVNKEITFETLSGSLYVKKTPCGKISMVFPSYMPVAIDEDVKDLIKVVVGDLPYQDVKYSPQLKKLVIRLRDDVQKSEMENFNPKPEELLATHNNGKISGVIVTLKASAFNGCTGDSTGQAYDFLTRFFAPWDGISEDPVCGSAHAVLAPYWASELGKKKLIAFQCSKRKGFLYLDASDDSKVLIKGNAFVPVQGSLQLN